MTPSRRPGRPRRTRRGLRPALVLASIAAVLATTGCGLVSSPKTAPDGQPYPTVQELYAQMREATLAADSGHATGFVTENGESMMFDLEGDLAGGNQRFRFRTDDRGAATVVTVGGQSWVSGDWDFWTAAKGDPAAGDSLKDQYVSMTSQTADIEMLSLGTIVAKSLEAEKVNPLWAMLDSVSLRTENDREIWVLHERDDELWVDRRTNLLVKVVITGDDASEVTFDSWNAAEEFRAPTTKA